MAADRPYGEFYDLYSVSPEYFGYHIVYIVTNTRIQLKCKHGTVIQIEDCILHRSKLTEDKPNRHKVESRQLAFHPQASGLTGCFMIAIVIGRRSLVPSVGERLYFHDISFCRRQNILSCVIPLLLPSLVSSTFQNSFLSYVSV
jgi:hypothetical protein